MKKRLDNIFYAKEIDIRKFEYPKVYVKSWGQVIGERGKMGSFCVQADKTEDRLWLTIKEYPVYVGDNQKKIRKNASATARRFNENLEKNWDDILLSAFKEIIEFEENFGRDKEYLPQLKKNILYLENKKGKAQEHFNKTLEREK